MSVFQITYYTVLRNIRNWKLFLLLIGVPLLNYIMCANVITNVNVGLNFEKVKVAYLENDGGSITKQLTEFLNTKEILTSFEVQKVNSVDEGTRLVKDGEIEDFIYLKNDFSSSLKEGEKINIEILSNRENSPTRLIMESFINSLKAISAIHNIGEVSSAAQISSGIKNTAVSPTGKILRDQEKYPLIGMLEMLALGASLLGCFSVVNSIKRKTLLRFNISPINSLAYVSGQFLGNFLTMCPSGASFIVYLCYVWGLSLQGNIWNIILAFMLYTVILTALGMSVSYLTKKTGLSVLVVVCLTLILNSAATVYAIGTAQGFLKWIEFLSPQYYTYLIITDTIFDGLTSRIHGSLISLAILATALTAATLLLGRRKAV